MKRRQVLTGAPCRVVDLRGVPHCFVGAPICEVKEGPCAKALEWFLEKAR